MIELCHNLMNNPETWVILDTETTGLDNTAEAIQIGVLAPDGNVLLNTLVNPICHIPENVTHIHGITNEMVEDAPWSPDCAGIHYDVPQSGCSKLHSEGFCRRQTEEHIK